MWRRKDLRENCYTIEVIKGILKGMGSNMAFYKAHATPMYR